MLATARPERQILRVADLVTQLGLARTTIWRLRRAGEFPQPIRLSANAVGWPAHVIDEWLADRRKARREAQARASKARLASQS